MRATKEMEGADEQCAKRVKLSHSDSYKKSFKALFPELVKELTEDGLRDTEISYGIRHLKTVLDYNVPGGVFFVK